MEIILLILVVIALVALFRPRPPQIIYVQPVVVEPAPNRPGCLIWMGLVVLIVGVVIVAGPH